MTDTGKKFGSAYIPPAKLKLMQDELKDQNSAEYQRIHWELLKKSINGLINKANLSNLSLVVRDLMKENIVRGSGILCTSLIRAQASGPIFTNVYAALVAVINSKFPKIGELLISRLINSFRRCYKRNDKKGCLASAIFLAHLTNQDVIHEVLVMEMLSLLLHNATDDSVEISVAILKECGAKLKDSCPKGFFMIFELLRSIPSNKTIDLRTQLLIETMLAIRKDGFKDYPTIVPELDLLEEGDKITHELELDDKVDTKEELNVFRFDPKFQEEEEKYNCLKKEILGDDDDDDDEDDEEDDDEDEDSEGEGEDDQEKDKVVDATSADLVQLRRKIYLTLQSSLDFEEAAHKLLKLELKGENKKELSFLIIDCCAQQRTYMKFYGLLAARFCLIDREFVSIFAEIFIDSYTKVHRFTDTNKLRIASKFFAHLLYTDSISWNVLACIKLNEDDTTPSSRVFIKILFQELAEYMGFTKLAAKVKDPELEEAFAGLFPKNNPRDTRFSINFFSLIGIH
uniref:MI domain-containing protein n=1 Tax=Tetranychus urticae TaxID=32264 RepID=T1JVJ8_TETUR